MRSAARPSISEVAANAMRRRRSASAASMASCSTMRAARPSSASPPSRTAPASTSDARDTFLVLCDHNNNSRQAQRSSLEGADTSGTDGKIGRGNGLAHIGVDQQADSIRTARPDRLDIAGTATTARPLTAPRRGKSSMTASRIFSVNPAGSVAPKFTRTLATFRPARAWTATRRCLRMSDRISAYFAPTRIRAETPTRSR